MTSDYLWDGSGEIDPDVSELEQQLRCLRYRPQAHRPLRTEAPWRRTTWGALALAAIALLYVALGRDTTGIAGEEAVERPTPGAARAIVGAPPQAAGSGSAVRPRPAARGAVLDPWADHPRPATTPSAPIQDPFRGAPPATPPSGALVDPFRGAPPATPPSGALVDPFRGAPPASTPPTKGSDGVLNPWAGERTERSASDVMRVVSRQRSAVARTCWAPRQSKASPGTVARVQLSLTIAPSGHVARASAADPPGFPGLGSCVAGVAKSWRFSAAASASNVQIPFVFSRAN
ncbi:MAG: hypothetical protein R3B13_12340 [Polyangiaceae bacterium]